MLLLEHVLESLAFLHLHSPLINMNLHQQHQPSLTHQSSLWPCGPDKELTLPCAFILYCNKKYLKKKYLMPASSDRHSSNKRMVQCQDCLPADGMN